MLVDFPNHILLFHVTLDHDRSRLLDILEEIFDIVTVD